MSPTAQNVEETVDHSSNAAVPPWKMELNERLAATRLRRLQNVPEQAALPGLEDVGQKSMSRASRLAARVAQRYANAPSYSDVLAAQELARKAAAQDRQERLVREADADPVTDRASLAAFPDWHLAAAHDGSAPVSASGGEPLAMDGFEEPEEEKVVEPLAVNLIEFPRELVAQRKLRPRLAEGPLRESMEGGNAAKTSPGVSIGPAPANWSPIRLDEDAVEQPDTRGAGPLQQQTPVLLTASLEDRVMAAIFDLALVVSAFAAFVFVFVACSAHPPTGKPALMAAGLALAGFGLLYHYLFFRFAEGTPGMRYARIALCTFEDENPTRQAMCRRVLFLMLSAAPLGLGFLWACFDQDRLGWHDRISRMYQRSYS